MTSAGKSGRWRQRHRDDVDLRTPVAARLDCNLSRWRVVAKCLLALRLHIVLASPGLTVVVLTVAVLFPTLPTARSPRCTLDFNVRLLRCYYAYGAPGTDRYPPFRPRMCQTTRPILTVTAATGCPGLR
jgi:hypothetical protein